MDQTVVTKTAPYFDLDRSARGDRRSLRALIPGRIHAAQGAGRAPPPASSTTRGRKRRRQLERDGDGRACAEGLSRLPGCPDQARLRVHHQPRLSRRESFLRRAHGDRRPRRLWPRACWRRAPTSIFSSCFPTSRPPGARASPSTCSISSGISASRSATPRAPSINACGCRRSDMTIRTALLDARLILGDEQLFAEFQRRFRKDVLEGNARPFIEPSSPSRTRATPRRRLALSGRAEHQGRQRRLRDLHTLHWLAKHLYPDKAEAEFVEAGVFTRREYRELPPLRELPLDGALPVALPDRPARGAPELRPAAADGRAARLSRPRAACARSSAS